MRLHVVRKLSRPVTQQFLTSFHRTFSIRHMDSVQLAKRAAAYAAVDENLSDNQVIGVGSGSTIVHVVERMAQRIHQEGLNIVCIPTSFQAKQLISKHKLTLSDLETNPKLDVAFDGADESDPRLNLIKGGGGCLMQEKIVASCADKFVVVADDTKDSTALGQTWKKGIPIEVHPMAYVPIAKKLEKQFGGHAELRIAVNKAGPVVTDNGNLILDWRFIEPFDNWGLLNQQIRSIPGVLETGLFIDMVWKGYFGSANGKVLIRTKEDVTRTIKQVKQDL